MSTDDIRSDRVQHPLSKQAMAARINRLVNEMDHRAENSNPEPPKPA